MRRRFYRILPRLALVLALLIAPLVAGLLASRAHVAGTATAAVAGFVDSPLSSVIRPGGPAHTQRLRILSYNVHGLPLTNASARFAAISDLLGRRHAQGRAPDFVLLQEMFFGPIADFVRASGYPFAVEGPEGGLRAGSGLVILSAHPIVRQERSAFPDCAWTDCLARKGVMAVWAQVPGLPTPITVLNTHLQAWRKYDSTRRRQVDTLASFLDRIGAERRFTVFGGDFNMRLGQSSYDYLLARTRLRDVGRICLDIGAVCRGGDAPPGAADAVWAHAIDRHFTYPTPATGAQLRPVATTWIFRDETVAGEPLSDHWGYEVEYEARW